MADSKPAPEPTMEEILSSIRRIIAEDEDKDDGAPRAAAQPNPAGPEGVLDLTEVVPDAEPPRSRAPAPEPASSPRPAGGLPPAASVAAPPASDDGLAADPGPTPVYTRPPSLARSAGSAMPPDAADSLISADTAKASAQALARLTRANANEERRPGGTGGANVPIDQFLGDLLTPLLREWLEQHLPGIVERVVEQEVKKLARRAELL